MLKEFWKSESENNISSAKNDPDFLLSLLSIISFFSEHLIGFWEFESPKNNGNKAVKILLLVNRLLRKINELKNLREDIFNGND